MNIPDLNDGIVAVDYVVSGPRLASAVARGESRLAGLAVAVYGQEPWYTDRAFREVLGELGTLPRVFDDAVFSRVVERINGLPGSPEIHDVRAMAQLLGSSRTRPNKGDEPPSETERAACARAHQTRLDFSALYSQLTPNQLLPVYSRIEIPLVDTVATMTVHGLQVDDKILESVAHALDVRLGILRAQINEIARRSLNPDSPEEVAAYLYQECGLPPQDHTRHGNPSVGADALYPLAGCHPVIPPLIEYRTTRPQYDAVSAIQRFAVGTPPRVHPELDPLGAATGRFSCSNPNIQSLPVPARSVVRAADGHRLIELDISQAELRVLAHFSQEPKFLRAFREGAIDLHQHTSALALGVPEGSITPEQRKIGKRINFGIVYGQTEHSLSRQLGVSRDEAKQFIDRFFAGYPQVAAWIEHVKQQAHACGYVCTLYGRRRILPGLQSADPGEVAHAERQAVNTVIQGTAADLFKLALPRIQAVSAPDCKMLLVNHDSVLLEAPERAVEEVARQVAGVIESPIPEFAVPLRVDWGSGKNWADCKTSSDTPVAGDRQHPT